MLDRLSFVDQQRRWTLANLLTSLPTEWHNEAVPIFLLQCSCFFNLSSFSWWETNINDFFFLSFILVGKSCLCWGWRKLPGGFYLPVCAYWIFKFLSDAHNNTHLTLCDWHFQRVFVFVKKKKQQWHKQTGTKQSWQAYMTRWTKATKKTV